MTGPDRPTSARHNDLIWPAALLGSVMIAALCIIIVTGHSTDDLVRSIGALSGVYAATVSTAGWVRSTQAAKQTDGELDARIKSGVHEGITLALQQAAQQPGRRRRAAPDAPTEKLPAPKK